MPKLFEKTRINGMELGNRFVRSATWEGMAAEDGKCTAKLKDVMTHLAKGRVGLIISSHAYVQRDGQAGPWQLGIYQDELVPDLHEMTQAVHEQGGRIALQMAHAGMFAFAKATGTTPKGPSNVEGFTSTPREEMTVEEIHGIVQSFGLAARRGKEAGFDAVQIHAAHGYLLSQFLSPAFNKRSDAYGGPLRNRARCLMEVLQEVRAAVGPDYPVLVKMNCRDDIEGGLITEDALKVGEMLQEGGIDAIELSGGTIVSKALSASRIGITSPEKEAYFKDAARVFKERLDVPLMLVGGVRSHRVAEQLIENGYADYISMSRPFIREPDLIRRWEGGDLRKAACVSDNKCFGPAVAGEGIYCVVKKKQEEKKSD